MKKGLLNIDWNDISSFSEEDISYFLFLEGKSIDCISLIRKLEKGVIQNHIISGKIKYRILAKSNSATELFATILRAGKDDKLNLLKNLDLDNKKSLAEFIRNKYQEFDLKEKEAAIWMVGELKQKECIDILTKASVNKIVNLRRMAVSALGKLEDISVEIVLIRALEDENPQVVQYAIKALQRVKSTKGKEKVGKIMQLTDKEYLKRAAEEYMASL